MIQCSSSCNTFFVTWIDLMSEAIKFFKCIHCVCVYDYISLEFLLLLRSHSISLNHRPANKLIGSFIRDKILTQRYYFNKEREITDLIILWANRLLPCFSCFNALGLKQSPWFKVHSKDKFLSISRKSETGRWWKK